MKLLLFSLLLALPLLAPAQTQRDLTEISMDLYQQANSPQAMQRMAEQVAKMPESYIVSAFQPGTLLSIDGKRRRVPGLRYNVALRILEVRDSTGTHVWPVGSLRGFDLGVGNQVRRFRARLFRENGTTRDFLEILTAADEPPVVLAMRNRFVIQEREVDPVLRVETRKERREIEYELMAGPGNQPTIPLQRLTLNQKNVLRLFGTRAEEIGAYASQHGLHYDDLAQLLQLVEYYNASLTAPTTKP